MTGDILHGHPSISIEPPNKDEESTLTWPSNGILTVLVVSPYTAIFTWFTCWLDLIGDASNEIQLLRSWCNPNWRKKESTTNLEFGIWKRTGDFDESKKKKEVAAPNSSTTGRVLQVCACRVSGTGRRKRKNRFRFFLEPCSVPASRFQVFWESRPRPSPTRGDTEHWP